MIYFESLSSNRTFIMGCSIISIMLFHNFFFANCYYSPFHRVGHWGVDMFMFISGYGIAFSLDKHPLQVYFTRRFIRLFPSCLIWGISSMLITYIDTRNLNIGINILCLDHWFIVAIILFYILAWPMKYIIGLWGMKSCILISIICFLLVLPISEIDSYYKGIISRFPAFILGMYIARKYNYDVNRLLIACLWAFFLLLLLISLTGFFKGRPNEYVYVVLAPTLIVVAPLIGKFALLMKHKIPPLYKFICFMGNISLQLYLCHEYTYSFINSHYHLHPYGLLCLAIFLSIAIACVLQSLSDKATKKLQYIIGISKL